MAQFGAVPEEIYAFFSGGNILVYDVSDKAIFLATA